MSLGKWHASLCILCRSLGKRLETRQKEQFFPVFSLLSGNFRPDWIAQDCPHSQALPENLSHSATRPISSVRIPAFLRSNVGLCSFAAATRGSAGFRCRIGKDRRNQAHTASARPDVFFCRSRGFRFGGKLRRRIGQTSFCANSTLSCVHRAEAATEDSFQRHRSRCEGSGRPFWLRGTMHSVVAVRYSSGSE